MGGDGVNDACLLGSDCGTDGNAGGGGGVLKGNGDGSWKPSVDIAGTDGGLLET